MSTTTITTKMINAMRLLLVLCSLIWAIYLMRSVVTGPILPLGEKVELLSAGTYIKGALGLVVFVYMTITGTHILVDKEFNEVRGVKLLLIAMCLTSVVCLFSRNIYSSKINNSNYVECKSEERSSLYYSTKFFAKDSSLCRE